MSASISIRRANRSELPVLQTIREAAFAPVFASFRAILGDAIYEVAQAKDDEGHAGYLESLFAQDSVWVVHAVDLDDRTVGFMALRFDPDAGLGEIGLNAVHPDVAGQGIGTALYDFALDEMTDAGLAVAVVGTGGDPSHAPARRAYEKAGFDVGIPSVWMCCDLSRRSSRGDAAAR
jgi:GNAT superfamily N-acetyltransferase